MESVLTKTKNYYRCIGSVYENALKREDCDIKLRDKDGNDAGKTKGERIMGTVSVRTPNGIHTFSVYFQNLTSKGETNKQWKMACDMLEWNPEINGNGNPATEVNIEGTVGINDYYNPNTKKVSSSLRWRVGRGNTMVNDEKGCSLNAVGIIYAIKPEIRNEEETGRLLVTIYGAESNGTCFPIDAIVDKEMADDFTDAFEVGQTVNFDFDLVSRHIGAKPTSKKAFGKAGSVTVNSGFDIDELMIVGADDPIEEPEEKFVEDEEGKMVEVKTDWIDLKTMKAAIKVRQQMLDELEKNPPAPKKSGKSDSFAEKKARAMAATKKRDVNMDFGEDDDPF